MELKNIGKIMGDFMGLTREDSLDIYYKKINTLGRVNDALFWAVVFFSITLHFITDSKLNTWFNVVFILTTLVFFVVDIILTMVYKPQIEKKRKTHLLSDSFEVPLDNERTNGYYNNFQRPSIVRLGLNVFENALFSLRVSEKMLPKKRIKVTIYLMLWFLLLIIRETQIGFLSIIAQTLFSTRLISDWIRLELYKWNMQQIFDNCRKIFIHNNVGNSVSKGSITEILNQTIEYESVKARMGVSLSSKLFYRLNSSVSEEWDRIKENLEIS